MDTLPALEAGPFHRAPDAAPADRHSSSPPAPRPPPLITPRCAKPHAPRQSGIQAPSSQVSCQLRTTHHTCLGAGEMHAPHGFRFALLALTFSPQCSAPRSRRSVRASHIGFALPPASHLKRTRIGNRQGQKTVHLSREPPGRSPRQALSSFRLVQLRRSPPIGLRPPRFRASTAGTLDPSPFGGNRHVTFLFHKKMFPIFP